MVPQNSKGIDNTKRFITTICVILSLAAVEHACTAGTQVVSWGSNFYNETNVPAGLTNIIQVSAYGPNGSALQATRIPVQWGSITNDPNHKVPTSLTNAVLIGAGADPYNLALTSDGRIVGWGGNDYGCSTPPAGTNRYVALSAGYIHSLGVTTEGKVLAWGDNSSGQTNVPTWLSNVVAVAAGEFHSLALRSDGTVAGWGQNFYGESTGSPTSYSTNGIITLKGQTLNNVVAIAARIDRFSVALKKTVRS
jgi:trimeric autotransporter adhesin